MAKETDLDARAAALAEIEAERTAFFADLGKALNSVYAKLDEGEARLLFSGEADLSVAALRNSIRLYRRKHP